ncbi:proline racemase family protein [Mesorhizobium sp. M0134]|uniref:proline racemase family protein n=1 Tax=Mesorhizobium sp. M0134 TaxID=2956889 RepID=UPI00333952E8
MHICNQVFAIDHHHGQASRTILSGYPSIRGATMREKAAYYSDNMSWIHESLLREPRGHRNMLGSIITDPVSDEAAFGVIFLHPSGMFDGCGDSTFATAAAAIESGLVKAVEPITRFTIDSVLGPLHIEADVNGGVVSEVRFGNVPSYRVGSFEAALQGRRRITIDVSFGGLYYGFIDADALGLELAPEAESQIVSIAQELWRNLGQELAIKDDETDRNAKLDLFTFVRRQSSDTGCHYLVANVYPPGSMGRTPSGTGTSAHMALRAAQGELKDGDLFIQESVLGMTFRGYFTTCTLSRGGLGINPLVGTKSYMMAISHFVIDPADPFARGFIMPA